MTGSHYNRAWFVQNIMSEALERLLLTRFLCEVSFKNYFISVILKHFWLRSQINGFCSTYNLSELHRKADYILIFKSCLFKVKPDIKDEWIDILNDIERLNDQDLLGYQTLLMQYEKFKTKIRNGELGKTTQF